MKKVLVIAAAMMAVLMSANAEEKKSLVTFQYEAGAEVVSSYIWRGLYNGGLSFQPTASVGFDAVDEDIQFRVGVWASLGASDWQFKKGTPDADGNKYYTYFVPETDFMASLRLWGATLGVTHYYYYGGTPFFSGLTDDGGSQTEVQIGYDLGQTLENVNLYFNWYSIVAGNDVYEATDKDGNPYDKRAFSSYIEIGYRLDMVYDMTLEFQIGMTPWKSLYTDYEGGFAVNNIYARFGKTWNVKEICDIELFASGSINTYKINKDNLFVNAAGDAKIGGTQRLNGTIGVGFWF